MTVTSAQGFRAAGVTVGLKPSGTPDIALVVNDGPKFAGAGVFTSNRVHAAPVKWSRQVVADGVVSAVVLNSGGANACTGAAGFADTHATAERVAAATGLSAADVAVCSTGLIGERLPMDLLLPGVDKVAAALSATGGADAAEAIRTTDTVAKQAVHRDPSGWTVGGMAKGAAMLSPALATMLVVVTTDADVDAAALHAAVAESSRLTFDRVDTDASMSTNDTVLLLASGASGIVPDADAFAAAVHAVCADLALQLVADAEGASKQVRVDVVNAASEEDALEVARAVGRYPLLKCALRGNDPNWGRVLAAVGITSAAFDADELDVAMNGVWICRSGGIGEDRSLVDLTPREVTITVDLKAGDASAFVLTTDLTEEYVRLNSEYST